MAKKLTSKRREHKIVSAGMRTWAEEVWVWLDIERLRAASCDDDIALREKVIADARETIRLNRRQKALIMNRVRSSEADLRKAGFGVRAPRKTKARAK